MVMPGRDHEVPTLIPLIYYLVNLIYLYFQAFLIATLHLSEETFPLHHRLTPYRAEVDTNRTLRIG